MISHCISSNYAPTPITIHTLAILTPQTAASDHPQRIKLFHPVAVRSAKLPAAREPRKRVSKASKLSLLDSEIHDFLDRLYLTNEEWSWRGHILQQIDSVVQEIFGDTVIMMNFGSAVTGLSLPWSDLDVALLFRIAHDRVKVVELLEQIEEKLNAGMVFEEVTLVSGASVPVLKFRERLTKIKVDISINNSHGKETTMLIQGFGVKYAVFNDLVLLLKHYLWERNCSESSNGGINTYLLSHMVVNMLQNSQTIAAVTDSLAFAFYAFLQYYSGKCSFDPSSQSIIVSNRINQTFTITETLYVNNRNAYLSLEDLMVEGREIGGIAYKFGQVRVLFERDFYDLHLVLHDGAEHRGLLKRFVKEDGSWQAYREQIVAIWQGMGYCDKLE